MWYVSGAISGHPAGIPQAKDDFARYCLQIRDWGYQILNPFDIPACEAQNCVDGMSGWKPVPGAVENQYPIGPPLYYQHAWHCNMRHDIKAMLDCEGIILLPNWTLSRGSRLEFNVAMDCGLSATFYEDLRILHEGH